MSDKQFPASESQEVFVLKQRFLHSKCSPIFWLFFFSVIFVRRWWKERDTAQYRCHQSKRKTLLVPCSATHHRTGKTLQKINTTEDEAQMHSAWYGY